MITENFYQKFLESHLCGKHCKLPFGETDVTTDDIHAEIKAWTGWKSGFGQLLYYNSESYRPDLRLYIYGQKPKSLDMKRISNFLKSYDISLYTLHYKDGLVTIKNVDNDSSEKVEWDIEHEKVSTILTDEVKEEIKQALSKKVDGTNMIINIDDMSKWLSMRKDHAKTTVISSYKEGVDYKINKIIRPTVGRPSEQIMLTTECFKLLCMKSTSKHAHALRSYFRTLWLT